MEHPEFIEKPDYSIQNISALLDRYKEMPKVQGRNWMNEITDLRQQTAQLIGKPVAQVFGLTRGWSSSQIYQVLKVAQSFTANPGACWWVIWKQKNPIYGKSKKEIKDQRLQEIRERRWRKIKATGQQELL